MSDSMKEIKNSKEILRHLERLYHLKELLNEEIHEHHVTIAIGNKNNDKILYISVADSIENEMLDSARRELDSQITQQKEALINGTAISEGQEASTEDKEVFTVEQAPKSTNGVEGFEGESA